MQGSSGGWVSQKHASVAQLGRASDLYSDGRGFKSLLGLHIPGHFRFRYSIFFCELLFLVVSNREYSWYLSAILMPGERHIG